MANVSNRFDYVKYDQTAENLQGALKESVKGLDSIITALALRDPTNMKSRSADNAIKSLEEFYMWAGKAIRDDQIARNGSAPLQEGRTNS